MKEYNLGNREYYESIQPKPLEVTQVVRRNVTCVPHELSTPNDQRFARHVRQPELKQELAQMHQVRTRAKNGQDNGQRNIHVETRGPTGIYRNRVEDQRIDGQGNATCQQDRAVPLPDALAAWVQDEPEPAQGAALVFGRDQGGPVWIVRVIPGGVENWDTRLSAKIAVGVVGKGVMVIAISIAAAPDAVLVWLSR